MPKLSVDDLFVLFRQLEAWAERWGIQTRGPFPVRLDGPGSGPTALVVDMSLEGLEPDTIRGYYAARHREKETER